MSLQMRPFVFSLLAAVLTSPGDGTVLGAGPRDGEPCTEDFECDDNNPCTLDDCTPEEICANIPVYDVASMCCHPMSGQSVNIDCEDPSYCYDPVCFPGSCICCDRPDGDPCIENPVPAISEWGMVTMTLTGLCAGTVILRRKAGA